MLERQGKTFDLTWQAHEAAGLGQVWEEDEFWIELSWRIDPDGRLGIRRYFESPYRPGAKLRIEEFYRWIFEHSVPGLPEAATREGLTPLAYMRKYGAFLVEDNVYRTYESPAENGVVVDGTARVGFPTPSRKLEFFSKTLKDWKWPEHAVPGYIRSHVHWSHVDHARGEMVLLPTFRLPTLIHTRSGNAKWLYEISHTNPLWLHPEDAARLAVVTGDLLRVTTAIGYFVDRVWATEAIRPGVIACSHHLGRWRLHRDAGGERWSTALVDLQQVERGKWRMRQREGVRPFASDDPDSARIWWTEAGVHQNLTFPVQPDPLSGQHCWHQKVTVAKAGADDRYGDIVVDTNKSFEVYREWLTLAVNLEGLIGVHNDVAVAIVGSRLGDRDLLVPAVLAAQGIGLDRERQVLVDARLRPPDPRRVGVVARERPDALPLAHPPLPALDLLEVDERGGPALASRVPVKSPSPQMVRARDHAGADRLRRPDPIDEVADRRRDPEEIARDDGEPGSVFGMQPQRIGVRDLVEPLRVARARVDERREQEGRQEHHLAIRAVDLRPVHVASDVA